MAAGAAERTKGLQMELLASKERREAGDGGHGGGLMFCSLLQSTIYLVEESEGRRGAARLALPRGLPSVRYNKSSLSHLLL